MALHDPVTFSRIVRGMIDIQKHEGHLVFFTDCSMYLITLLEQGGCLNVVVLQ